MKIAYVYDVIYPFVRGGAQKRVWEIAKRLAKEHEVHLFGMKHWKGEDVLVRDEVSLHGVCSPLKLYVDGKRSIKEPLYFSSKILLPLLKENVDLIDCQEAPYFTCFSSKFCSSLKNTPFVITWYELWGDYWYEYLGLKGCFGKIIENLALKLPNIIIPISERIKEDLLKNGVSKKFLRVVPNGVDFQRIQSIKAADEKFDVLYVGRLMSHKNVDVLLNALSVVKKIVPDVRCGIIGDGPEMANLNFLCEKLGLLQNVKFFGFVKSDEKVYSYMKSSKIFVIPSIREGFPNTILEANACRLPVITINHEKNAGAGVVKDGHTGYVIPFSSKELAKKILHLLQNKSVLMNLGKNSVKFAKQHDWNVIVRKIEKVYLEFFENESKR